MVLEIVDKSLGICPDMSHQSLNSDVYVYMFNSISTLALSYNFAIDQYHPLHQKKSKSQMEGQYYFVTLL